MNDPVLDIDDLTVEVRTTSGVLRPVRNVSLRVDAGEVHGVVGESGCGKSTLLRGIIGLLPANADIVGGEVRLDGVPIVGLPERERHRLRGQRMGMVFQDASAALNPVLTVGSQLIDGPIRHLGLSRRAARRRAVELLERVGVPDAEQRLRSFPHQLSGGLRQRVMIAVALSSRPQVLLCDEPTTALDVTIQDQILGLLDDIRSHEGVGIVFVSHNLAVVASLCDDVTVMYAGRVVETGPTGQVFETPVHPYTTALLASLPDVWAPAEVALQGIPGSPPDFGALPQGCAFSPRCHHAGPACYPLPPPLVPMGDRQHACVRPTGSALPALATKEHHG